LSDSRTFSGTEYTTKVNMANVSTDRKYYHVHSEATLTKNNVYHLPPK